MEYFVKEDSIVREIWGKDDTILFIFTGAAAEFALSKAVDWLYFTGRLPADPLGRLFSTVAYARKIVFSEKKAAFNAIDIITSIHEAVEQKRSEKIPQWAYRNVLFMLIDYSINSFELLERELSIDEKKEVFHTFYKVGERMGLEALPETYEKWLLMREEGLHKNLEYSHFTADLYKQYKKHLGLLHYTIMLQVQALIVDEKARKLLGLKKLLILKPLPGLYKLGKNISADKLLKALLLPSEYKKEIRALNR